MAMHTLQPGMESFEGHDGVSGYIGYRDYGPFRYTVGDPVCPPEATYDLLLQYHQSHPRITFFHINRSTARILRDMGYYANQLGEEGIIDLAEHSWSGRGKEDIRRQHNNALKSGVVVRESDGDPSHGEEARRISGQWLGVVKKGKKELRFAARRPEFPAGAGVREFYGFCRGRMEAFVQFDTVYRDGKVEGYLPSVSRRRPGSPKGTQALIIREAMGKFRQEGVARLYLGLFPANKVEDQDDPEMNPSRMVSRLFGWMGRSRVANMYYPFKSLSFHKTRYRARSRKVYMAFSNPSPVMDLILFGRMVGVL